MSIQKSFQDHDVIVDNDSTLEEFDETIGALQEVCKHNWIYSEDNCGYSYYHCTICGLVEEM